MPPHPRPLAVGLVDTTNTSQAERTQTRITLALRAAEEGYALIETFETGSNGVKEDAAFQALEELAVQLDADAVVHAGEVNVARVEDMAERVRLMVIAA